MSWTDEDSILFTAVLFQRGVVREPITIIATPSKSALGASRNSVGIFIRSPSCFGILSGKKLYRRFGQEARSSPGSVVAGSVAGQTN